MTNAGNCERVHAGMGVAARSRRILNFYALGDQRDALGDQRDAHFYALGDQRDALGDHDEMWASSIPLSPDERAEDSSISTRCVEY